MFGIPGKQAVTMTDKAAAQIAKLMAKDGHKGLRIGGKRLRGPAKHVARRLIEQDAQRDRPVRRMTPSLQVTGHGQVIARAEPLGDQPVEIRRRLGKPLFLAEVLKPELKNVLRGGHKG